MSDRYQFWAYIGTLGALVAVILIAFIAAGLEPALIGRLEAFGLGTITGGLIGVLRMPQRPVASGDTPQPVTVTNPDSDPVPVATAKE